VRHWAEALARDHLTARGWTLLAENAALRRGELDLVLRDGRTIVAVEVRQRRHDRYGDVAETLSRAKLARVRAGLRVWAWRTYRRDDLPLRVDAVLVRGGPEAPELEHLVDVGGGRRPTSGSRAGRAARVALSFARCSPRPAASP
jgi:putative endonuclease